MEQYEKIYVAMILRVGAEGDMRPVAVEWESGARYGVEKVLSARMSPPRHVGGMLTCKYRVLIGGREKTLYLETQSGRWFVEKLVST